MTVKHMIKGIPDRDVAFYIKEKDPVTVMEVCMLYERFKQAKLKELLDEYLRRATSQNRFGENGEKPRHRHRQQQ